jgi:hypothetical protein
MLILSSHLHNLADKLRSLDRYGRLVVCEVTELTPNIKLSVPLE